MTFGILGFAFVVGQPTSVTAEQSDPWCAQGDNILHCYYMSREQCEAAVNNHGFCVANSNVPILNNEARQPRLRRRRWNDRWAQRIAANIAKLPEYYAEGSDVCFWG